MSILVVGSVAFDTIRTPFGDAKEALGGSATYFSYAASFFSPVSIVAVVGTDFPKQNIQLLTDRGISTEGLEVVAGKTFRWTGSYENDMNAAKTHATDLNVFETFKPKISSQLAGIPHVFLANIDPDLQLSVLEQTKKPALVGCDTMNLWINIKPDSLNRLLQRVDLFLLNEGEARLFTGIANLVKAGYDLLKRGPKIVVIKKGEHGAILLTKDFFFVSPAYPVEDVFDPTGAGDCFAGGFFGSLVTNGKFFNETSLRQSVIYGTIMASFNVESFSIDRLKTVHQRDIVDRYVTFQKHTHFDTADHSSSFRPATFVNK